MRPIQAIVLSIVIAGSGMPSANASGKPMEFNNTCFTLSDTHKAARKGNDALVVNDGDTHLLIEFGGYCNATALSSAIQISTDGKTNVVCPQGTKVSSKRDHCNVRNVSTISAEEFQRHARRRR